MTVKKVGAAQHMLCGSSLCRRPVFPETGGRTQAGGQRVSSDHESQENRENRRARYRMLAKEAEDRAVKATSREIREEFTTLAKKWHKLADEVCSN